MSEPNPKSLANDCIPTAMGHHCPTCNPEPPPPSALVTIDGDMIREVSRIQHDKTLQAVRDLVEAIETTKKGPSYGRVDRSVTEYRADLLAGLAELRESR